MITWMQKHKKWLVITIWISTIAFVGAGFVGWGSYDYGKKGGVIALVGDREVTVEEYQNTYSSLYDQYSKAFGSVFNQEMADKLNLKDMALNQTIQNSLILAYADDLGLGITNEDIAKKLVKYKAFLKDGKFDKDTYQKVLAQNRTSIKDFESSLERGILLEKVKNLLDIEPTKTQIESLGKLLYLEDDIEYKILSLNDVSVTIDEKELKKYWEENKNSYMSEVTYELLVSKISLTKSNYSNEEIKSYYDKFKLDFKKLDGKLKTLDEAKQNIIKALDEKTTKKTALKQYLKYKKGEEKMNLKEVYTENSLPFGKNNSKVLQAKSGTLIKPFLHNNEYVTLKIENINMAKPLSFEKAYNKVKIDYTNIQKEKQLDLKANKELKTFKGEFAKSLTRESVDKIKGLDNQETMNFLNQLFASSKKESIINLGNKVVLFKILDSRFAKYDPSKDDITKNMLKQMENQSLMINLIKKLQKNYEVKTFINEKE